VSLKKVPVGLKIFHWNVRVVTGDDKQQSSNDSERQTSPFNEIDTTKEKMLIISVISLFF
jgi:hypothetical protein